MYMQARYYDPVIGRFYSNDPIGFRDIHSFNRYAYANNNPYKYVDPDGRATVHVQLNFNGKMGNFVANSLNSMGFNQLNASGGSLAVGFAVSFPAFDGAQFDAGVTFAGSASGIMDNGQLPSLPGASGGLNVSGTTGSVSDLSGMGSGVKVQGNLGKTASNAIVDAVANNLPDGKVRDFVNGSVRKAANSLLGLTGSAGGLVDDQGNITGGQIGLEKGINNGVSAEASKTLVCSVRSGCE